MLKKFSKNNIGAVTVVGALVLPLLLGMVALVAEFGQGLSTKVENQRVADLSAIAGALAYNSSSSQATMTSAAIAVAGLNGIPASGVSSNLVSSPTGDGNQAVTVTITSTNNLVLATILGFGSHLPVTSSSYAEVSVQEPACIVALNGGGTGVTLSGSTSVSAPGCSVASDASVSAPCGTAIITKVVAYDSASPPSDCSNITAPSGGSVKFLKTVTADPLAADVAASGLSTHMASVASSTAPGGPNVPTGASDIYFDYGSDTAKASITADGCNSNYSKPTWTVTCPAGATLNFGNITLQGGITVNFNTGGDPSTIYNFASIANTGSTMNFGPGTYNVAQGITTAGGTTTTFGAGTFNVGASTSLCGGRSGVAYYSICNIGTSLTFGGPSNFVLAAGVYNGGGVTMTLGSGSTNSFQIGPSSGGDALYVDGGSTTTFANASEFTVVGNVDAASGGGSCLTVSAAPQHDINGNFSSAGGTVLGAGVYTVNGYFALGPDKGGDVTCNGQSIGMTGTGVTLAISGVDTLSSGDCSGQAFCVTAGYSNVSLTAPTGGPTANLVVVGPQSSSITAGAAFAGGASGMSLSGALYFPNGPVSISAGASVGSGPNQCLELIGTQVTLSGGGALASTCVQSGGPTASSVLLVQ